MKFVSSPKNGAALLITLGALTLLSSLILSLALRIRTDRLASRQSLHRAHSKLLLQSAMSRAKCDIDHTMHEKFYPPFMAISSTYLPEGVNHTSPLISHHINLTRPVRDDFFAGAIETEFIPQGHPTSPSPLFTAYQHEAAQSASWQTVKDARGLVHGRIGYIIVNLSGLIDANQAGGYTNFPTTNYSKRLNGRSPSELQLSAKLLQELNRSSTHFPHLSYTHPAGEPHTTIPSDLAAGLALVYNRNQNWKTFETLRALYLLNRIGQPDILTSHPASFCTHSFAPRRIAPDRQPLRNINTVDEAEFTRIMTAHCSLSTSQSATLYRNLLDYMDPDDIPHSLIAPCTEAIPMINEIAVQNLDVQQQTVASNEVKTIVSGEILIETWYPFSDQYTHKNCTLKATAIPESSLPTSVQTISSGYLLSPSENTLTFILNYPDQLKIACSAEMRIAHEIIYHNFCTTTFSFSQTNQFHISTSTTPRSPHAITIQFDSLSLQQPSPVDRVKNIVLNRSLPSLDPDDIPVLSCVDPRINYDASNTEHWRKDLPPTPNQLNPVNWGEEQELKDKTAIRLFVRNAPLKNAAELGLISIGIPWRTIRLYHSSDASFPLHPILDFFHAGEPELTVESRKGLININTRHPQVAATAFYRAPIEAFPEGPSIPLSSIQAMELGQQLSALPQPEKNNRLSRLGEALHPSMSHWDLLTDAQRESIVANSYRLFTMRDNLFAIILIAQQLSDNNHDKTIQENEVLMTTRALAYLWRDPLTGAYCTPFYANLTELARTGHGGESWAQILDAFRPQ